MKNTHISESLLLVVLVYSCGAVETTDTPPDLLTMLETVKGGGDVSEFFNFLKDMKVVRQGMSMVENVSPLMKSIYGKAAKKSPRLRILLEVMNGHMPDVHDIYQFITTKSGNMLADILSVERQNSMYQQLISLVSSQHGQPTLQGMTKLAEIVFGKTLDFNEDLFQKTVKGKVMDLTADEIPEYNMLQLLMTFVDNYVSLRYLTKQLTQGKNGFSAMINNLGTMDMTHFQKIRTLPKILQDGKYQVGKHASTEQDPDVTQALRDISSARALKADDPESDSKAEALLLDATTRMFHLVTNIIKQSTLMKPATATPSSVNVFG